MVWARSIFSGVRGHHEPEATVLSLAMTMHHRPSTWAKAVTTPAAGERRPSPKMTPSLTKVPTS
jgi:hypothetical protein